MDSSYGAAPVVLSHLSCRVKQVTTEGWSKWQLRLRWCCGATILTGAVNLETSVGHFTAVAIVWDWKVKPVTPLMDFVILHVLWRDAQELQSQFLEAYNIHIFICFNNNIVKNINEINKNTVLLFYSVILLEYKGRYLGAGHGSSLQESTCLALFSSFLISCLSLTIFQLPVVISS